MLFEFDFVRNRISFHPRASLPMEMNGFVYCLCRIMSSYSFRGLHNRFNISQLPKRGGKRAATLEKLVRQYLYH